MIHYFLEKLSMGNSIESAVAAIEAKLTSIKNDVHRRWLEMELLKMDDHITTAHPDRYGISVEFGDLSDFNTADLNKNRYIIVIDAVRKLKEKILRKYLGKYGENNFIWPPFSFTCGENIFIGNNVNIGRDCFIQAIPNCRVIIEDGCQISASSIITAVYHLIGKEKEMPEQVISGKDIIIKSGVWIGSNVKILNSVTINEGAIVGAGAVVTKDIPSYAVAAGVPAKVIKYRK